MSNNHIPTSRPSTRRNPKGAQTNTFTHSIRTSSLEKLASLKKKVILSASFVVTSAVVIRRLWNKIWTWVLETGLGGEWIWGNFSSRRKHPFDPYIYRELTSSRKLTINYPKVKKVFQFRCNLKTYYHKLQYNFLPMRSKRV